MAKKKNYLNNEDLRIEILKCITDGYEKALKYGYKPEVKPFESTDPKEIELYEEKVRLGYNPERSEWISKIKRYDKLRGISQDKIYKMIELDEVSEYEADQMYMLHDSDSDPEEIRRMNLMMEKPVASEKLARMFQLIVENMARGFFWPNPDDGLDCKANAVLDLCSCFWKFEPVDSNGKQNSAFAFCTQIAYFGIAGALRILHPKKYENTISFSCIDENGKGFDLYNI